MFGEINLTYPKKVLYNTKKENTKKEKEVNSKLYWEVLENVGIGALADPLTLECVNLRKFFK